MEHPLRAMMLRSVRCLTIAIVALSVIVPVPIHACAWSNGGYSADPDDPDYGTHDWIADTALTMQARDVSFLETTYHTTYLLATEAPDNPDYIGDSVEHHVYYYSSGTMQDDASAERASDMYDSALERLEDGDFSVAAYYIGAMTHYIADVGVFGHTMGAYTDWGAEVHHSDYEGEFESRLDSIAPPPETPLGNMTAYDATTGLARDITFGAGDIMPNTWMDDTYDWSDDVFVDSAMASLYAAVSAVAATMNHLMFEAGYETPEEDEEEEEEEEEQEEEVEEGPTAPDAPRSLEAYIDEGHVTLTWDTPLSDGGEPIIEYRVLRSTGTAASRLVATVSSLTLSWTDVDVEDGETYTYRVGARNSVGQGDLSEVATVTIPAGDGLDVLLVAVISAVMAAVASGGALAWKRSRKGPGG